MEPDGLVSYPISITYYVTLGKMFNFSEYVQNGDFVHIVHKLQSQGLLKNLNKLVHIKSIIK